jgi:hypothetical protein
MPALKILQDISQLVLGGGGIECQDAVDDMVRPRLVRCVEIARLGRRPEGAHDDSRRIGPQRECLPVEKRSL